MSKTLLLLSIYLAIFINCITRQIGNPSNTIFINKGINGFSGMKAEASDKVGEACAFSGIWGIIAIGDASIQAAAKSGGIKKINTVTHDVKQSIFIQDYCTVVRGQ